MNCCKGGKSNENQQSLHVVWKFEEKLMIWWTMFGGFIARKSCVGVEKGKMSFEKKRWMSIRRYLDDVNLEQSVD
jgi:hypothetical protein